MDEEYFSVMLCVDAHEHIHNNVKQYQYDLIQKTADNDPPLATVHIMAGRKLFEVGKEYVLQINEPEELEKATDEFTADDIPF